MPSSAPVTVSSLLASDGSALESFPGACTVGEQGTVSEPPHHAGPCVAVSGSWVHLQRAEASRFLCLFLRCREGHLSHPGHGGQLSHLVVRCSMPVLWMALQLKTWCDRGLLTTPAVCSHPIVVNPPRLSVGTSSATQWCSPVVHVCLHVSLGAGLLSLLLL